jgi:hypothetical protein
MKGTSYKLHEDSGIWLPENTYWEVKKDEWRREVENEKGLEAIKKLGEPTPYYPVYPPYTITTGSGTTDATVSLDCYSNDDNTSDTITWISSLE